MLETEARIKLRPGMSFYLRQQSQITENPFIDVSN